MTKLVMGIDLGTTYSCVGVYTKDSVEIIENEYGKRILPSCVTFDKNEIIVGDMGKKSKNIQNKIYNIKRIIGKSFEDKSVQSDMELVDYVVVKHDDKLMVEIDWNGKKEYKTPQEISSIILKKLKEMVQHRFQCEINDCVISVPTRFYQSQREATKMAGTLAGLNVLEIINEPIAASIAYGVKQVDGMDRRHILVYDFGGGTLDVSLVVITDRLFEVKGQTGNDHLGGEDIDDMLLEHVIHDLKQKYPSTSIKSRFRHSLREKCEKLKCQLSVEPKGEIVCEKLLDGKDYVFRMTRKQFEKLCSNVFKEAMKPIHQMLSDCKIESHHIDDIILVGGTTKIPKIREMLEDFFHKSLNVSINPLESVAYGATVHAANIVGVVENNAMKTITLNSTPLSLGIETGGEFTSCIIPRQTPIPTVRTCTYTTHKDNQPSVSIKILEGERFLSKDNHVLGLFKLENIPKVPRGRLKIHVTYTLSSDNLLKIDAVVDGFHETKKSLTITNDSRYSNTGSVEKMMKELQQFEKIDRQTKEHRKLVTAYEDRLYVNLHNIEGKQLKPLEQLYQSEIEWVQENYKSVPKILEDREINFNKKRQDLLKTLTPS